MTRVFLLKQKFDMSSVLSIFCSTIKNKFGVSIKSILSENARDYFNQFLTPFLQREGIIHQSSCVETPQQYGRLGERTNICFKSLMLFYSKIMLQKATGEKLFWQQYLINRLPFKTPTKVFSEHFPDFSIFPDKSTCICSYSWLTSK